MRYGAQTNRSSGGRYAPSSSTFLKRHWRGSTTASRSLSAWYAAIEQFVTVFPKERVLVTSRTYAYQQQDWKLQGFTEAILAPFTPVQVHSFVERWYAFVGQMRGLRADEAQGRATLLNEAIRRSERLQEFAMSPLL